ncbi:MAG: tetraacyldisaccharide 4'-kinase [Chitinophagaceae bacterium]
MNFNSFFLRSFRILLLPVALLYGLIIIIRNWLYNKNIFKSAEFNFPLICVGNLAAGGTGKSPMVEYLIESLHKKFKVAIVSRGYKRKTSGYALANEITTALDIGDEPMQFHIKFPEVPVAVGEERLVAIPQLLHDKPDTEVIILDDAFQHREIKAGLNILLTEYNDLFTRDFFLPTGDLRDQHSSYKRAQIIIITKCPPDISVEEKNKTIKEIALLNSQQIFFTCIEYGTPYHIFHLEPRSITEHDEILLVCGIANPKPLKNFLQEEAATYYQQTYSDHYVFSIDDLKEINMRLDQISAKNKFIITTEKDAVRLLKFSEQLQNIPLYVLPIRHKFLFGEGEKFNETVVEFVKNFAMK